MLAHVCPAVPEDARPVLCITSAPHDEISECARNKALGNAQLKNMLELWPPSVYCADRECAVESATRGGHQPLLHRGEPRAHPLPAVACIFRQPSQRLLSSFFFSQHVQPPPRASTYSDSLLARVAEHVGNATHPGTRVGCAAKMLGGRGCGVPFEPQRLRAFAEQARATVPQLGFIGITERWLETVCLFHALFGGDVRPSELANTRPTVVGSTHMSTYDEALLQGFRDEDDELVYEVAVREFERRLAPHRDTVDRCVRKHANVDYRMKPIFVWLPNKPITRFPEPRARSSTPPYTFTDSLPPRVGVRLPLAGMERPMTMNALTMYIRGKAELAPLLDKTEW